VAVKSHFSVQSNQQSDVGVNRLFHLPRGRRRAPIKVDLAVGAAGEHFLLAIKYPRRRTHIITKCKGENILREKSLWLPAPLLCDPITHLQALRVTRFCNLSRLVSQAQISSFIYLLVDPALML
jgi:hypothetical protein